MGVKRLNYSEIVTQYHIRHIQAKGKSVETYTYIIERLMIFLHYRQDSMSLPAIVEEYITERKAMIKQGTLRRELMILRAALNWAKRNGYIAEVPQFDVPKEPPSKERWLTPAECKKLLEAAEYERVNKGGRYVDSHIGDSARAYRFIMIGLHTAARKQTILDLDWSQVDMKNRRINLNPEGRTQTSKRRPIVPMSTQLRDCLKWVKDKSGPVLNHHGSIQNAFYGAVRRAGLKNVTPHTLRHTFATISLQNGVNPYQVAGVMGDNLEMVLQRYGHHCPDYLKDAANLEF